MPRNGVVQSVHFNKQFWTKSTALQKLNDMGYTPIKLVHSTLHMLEYRIAEPKFDHYATLKRRNGIQIIVGFGAKRL